MKLLLPTFFVTLLVLSLQAQITNTAPATGVRLQSAVKRDGVSATNGPTQVGAHVVKAPAHLDEFIGTLLSVDKQNQTVSIALGPPSLVNQVKAKSFSIAPETKFYKNDAPAMLDGGVVGEAVRYRIRNKDNKQFLTILRFLPDFKGKETK